MSLQNSTMIGDEQLKDAAYIALGILSSKGALKSEPIWADKDKDLWGVAVKCGYQVRLSSVGAAKPKNDKEIVVPFAANSRDERHIVATELSIKLASNPDCLCGPVKFELLKSVLYTMLLVPAVQFKYMSEGSHKSEANTVANYFDAKPWVIALRIRLDNVLDPDYRNREAGYNIYELAKILNHFPSDGLCENLNNKAAALELSEQFRFMQSVKDDLGKRQFLEQPLVIFVDRVIAAGEAKDNFTLIEAEGDKPEVKLADAVRFGFKHLPMDDPQYPKLLNVMAGFVGCEVTLKPFRPTPASRAAAISAPTPGVRSINTH